MSIIDTVKRLATWDTSITPPDAVRAVGVPVLPRSHADLFTRMPIQQADWSTVGGANLEAAARTCVTVYACATYLADAVAESPLRVYRIVDGKLEEDPKHRCRALIAEPNPMMSEAEFVTLMVMTMAFSGYAVIEKVRSAANVPVELWPLRPDWLWTERRADNDRAYVYRVPGQVPRPIERDDILIVPYRHDHRQTTYGVSPLHIVAREVGIDVSLTDLLKVFLDAGGIPPYVLELPDNAMDKAEIDALQLAWQQKYGGSQAYGKLPVMHGGMKVTKIGDGINDMAWPDLRGLTELKIAQAFLVPAELIQARDTLKSGSLTTTEDKGAMARLQNHGAAPLRTRIDGAFTRGLLSDFTGGDPSYTIEFDISAILSLQEDEDARHLRVREDWNAGLMTLNEARIETDRPDLGANGEVFKVGANVMFVSPSDLAGYVPIPASITESAPRSLTPGKMVQSRRYRDTKALSERDLELRASSVRVSQRDRQRLTEIGARKLKAFFRAQGDRVIGGIALDAESVTHRDKVALSDQDLVRRVYRSILAPDATKDAVRPLDWDDEEARLRSIIEPLYDQAGKRAFATIADSLNASITWDVLNPNIGEVMHLLGLRIVDISETTRTAVVDVVETGLREGLGVDAIAANLSGLFDGYANAGPGKVSRAETIARSETAYAYSTASVEGYRQSGVVSEIELLDNDSHTESYGASDGLTCSERNGLVVSFADVQRHIDAEHPNGSLSTIGVLSTPLGE